jgi:hypothetical protein
VLGEFGLSNQDFEEVLIVTEETMKEAALDTREISDAKSIVERFRRFAVKQN